MACAAHPFSAVDKEEARPSSELPRGSEEGHRFKEELASEVNGYEIRTVMCKQELDGTLGKPRMKVFTQD